ncbi:CPBP family intramembrane glutamic endopeptidase [Gordonia sp. (in: high G+C Gram-positive bacteria)]|uniref:CPBP family intramembrane glutamic endopeptidase n=1 Tax=Gordonia sp. (in: high G+C Gram-positive bacteria) TaxID=84139 RepID=UPI003F9517DF
MVPTLLLAITLLFPNTWEHAKWFPLEALIAYVPMLIVQIITTSLAEEPGWRDFALPRLQQRWGAFLGTLVLGLLWGGWHAPLFLTDWAGDDVRWWGPVLFVLSCVPLSLVMTWVFNKTGQSIPMVMLLHAGINNTFSVLWPESFPDQNVESMTIIVQLTASTIAAVFLIIWTRGRLGLAPRERVSNTVPRIRSVTQ